MVTQASITSAADLLRMQDDGLRYELVEGEVRRMSPAGHTHGRIAMRLGWRLARFAEEKGLGTVYAAETGFLVRRNPDTVRAPDAAFVSAFRIEQAGTFEGYWPGAPDLVAEVVSPSDAYSDVEKKVIDWLDAGTRLVFVIDPRQRSVSVYRSRSSIRILSEGDLLEGADVLPGWSMPVRELFL